MRLAPLVLAADDGTPFELRSPGPEDAGCMLAFLRQLLHEASEYLNAPSKTYDTVSESGQVATLERMLRHERAFYLAAFDGATMVGNLQFTAFDVPVSTHCGELALGVLQSYQGRGIARAMLGRCVSEARGLGIWNLRFTVRTYNHRAIALYERHGFRRVGRLEGVAKIGDAYVDEFLYQGVFDGS